MYTILETFVGAGGSHLGFKKAGFKSVFVNDIDKNFLKTLCYNNPETEKSAVISNDDILNLDGNKILNEIKLHKGDLDVMFGGIVCKEFSLAGERSPNDPRNYFYRKQLELVKILKPKISIIENVQGIINAEILRHDIGDDVKNKVDSLWKKIENYKGQKAYYRKADKLTDEFDECGKSLRKEKDRLIKDLKENDLLISVKDDIELIYKELGYTLQYKVLNSSWYGAATKRDRVIFVAVRNDIDIQYKYPEKEYGDGTKNKLVTVFDALKLIDYTNNNDTDNVPMNHSEKTVERFKYIGQGENLAEKIDILPNELKISKFYSRGSTMRLDGNKPSPTLVPGHSNFPIHPIENRCIAVREAATITGFPTSYKFFGSHTKRCEQVGNAVPPALAYAVAKQCVILLDKYYKK